MAEATPGAKPGCRVEVICNCYDENGQIISDLPSGSWYGFDRPAANGLALDLTYRIAEMIEKYNATLYGEQFTAPRDAMKGKK